MREREGQGERKREVVFRLKSETSYTGGWKRRFSFLEKAILLPEKGILLPLKKRFSV